LRSHTGNRNSTSLTRVPLLQPTQMRSKHMDFQTDEAEKRMTELDKALKEIQSESRKAADFLSTTDLLKAVENVS